MLNLVVDSAWFTKRSVYFGSPKVVHFFLSSFRRSSDFLNGLLYREYICDAAKLIVFSRVKFKIRPFQF